MGHPLGQPEGVPGGAVQLVDEHERAVLASRGGDHACGGGFETPAHPPVVPFDAAEDEDEHGDRHDDHPGALGELRVDDDQRDQSRGAGAGDVDRQGRPPPGDTVVQPVVHHAGLREGEGAEHADDVQVNQRVDLGAVDGDQAAGEHREHVPCSSRPTGRRGSRTGGACSDRAPSAPSSAGSPESSRSRPGRAPPGSIPGRRRTRSAPRGCARTRSGDLCEDGDAARGAGVHPDGEDRDAEEERAAETAQPGERGAGILGLRPLEGGDAVCDRLDAREGAAARSERAQQQEQPDRARPHRECVGNDGVEVLAEREGVAAIAKVVSSEPMKR